MRTLSSVNFAVVCWICFCRWLYEIFINMKLLLLCLVCGMKLMKIITSFSIKEKWIKIFTQQRTYTSFDIYFWIRHRKCRESMYLCCICIIFCWILFWFSIFFSAMEMLFTWKKLNIWRNHKPTTTFHPAVVAAVQLQQRHRLKSKKKIRTGYWMLLKMKSTCCYHISLVWYKEKNIHSCKLFRELYLYVMFFRCSLVVELWSGVLEYSFFVF